MNDSSTLRSSRRRSPTSPLAAIVLAALLAFSGSPAWAHPEGPGAIEAYLHGLVEGGAITEAQHEQIERL